MRKIFFAILLMPAMLFAAPVDQNVAQQVAQNFFENAIQENVVKHRKASLKPLSHAGAKKIRRAVGSSYAPYYIFNNEDGGFVIVAGDDRVQPILAYSADGKFVQDDMPVQIQEWLDMYSEQIQYIADHNISNDSIKNLWKASSPYRVTATEIVSPLIQTQWKQSPYYNDKCPVDSSLILKDFHPTVGCVACAMGQVMKYYNFPSVGIGSHSYNSKNYGTLSANFGRTRYDWNNMPVRLSINSTQAEIDAVSTLLYHCGVSVDMNYNGDGKGSSGAYVVLNAYWKARKESAEESIVKYFGYNENTVKGKFKSDYTESSWMALLKNELDNKRPMLYAGSGAAGGHAFICDGYDSNNYFHFNWGWGGNSDGFFSIQALNVQGYDFTQDQQAIIGIIPDETSVQYDLAMYSDLETASSSYGFGSDMTITGKVENNGTGTFIGELRVGLYNSNDEFVGWSNESHVVTLTGGSHTDAKTFTFSGGIPYIARKYTAYMFYKETGASSWRAVRSDEGIFLTEYNNVSFNITYKINALRTYSAFNVQEGQYVTGNTAHIHVDVLNAGSSTFYGKIKLCLRKKDGSAAQDIDVYTISSGIKANSTYSGGLTFVGTVTVDPGTYYLTLLYQNSGESVWYYVGCDQYTNPMPINVVAPPLVADRFEENNSQPNAAVLLPDFDASGKPTFGTEIVSLHETTDVDYYKVNFPAGYKYTVTIDLYDSYNRVGSTYYSGDAKLAYSLDGQNYNGYYDNGVDATNKIVFEGPRTMYIEVVPFIEEWIGTYEMAGYVTREKIEGADTEITISAKMPLTWGSTISAWAWPDGLEGSWVTLQKDGDWYSYATSVYPLNIVFVNGSGWTEDKNQTVDITVRENTCVELYSNGTSKCTYMVVDCPQETPPDPPVPPVLDRYVVVANRNKTNDKNWYYMTSDLGSASTKRYQAVDAGTSDLSAVNTSNLDSKYYWSIDGNKLKTEAGYSAWSSGNSAKLDQTGIELTIQQQADGTYTFSFADGEKTRYLALNNNSANNYFAYYSGTNQVYKLTLIKEGEHGSTQDIDQITNNQSPTTHKIIRDGHIFILRGDKMYTIQGQEVR